VQDDQGRIGEGPADRCGALQMKAPDPCETASFVEKWPAGEIRGSQAFGSGESQAQGDGSQPIPYHQRVKKEINWDNGEAADGASETVDALTGSGAPVSGAQGQRSAKRHGSNAIESCTSGKAGGLNCEPLKAVWPATPACLLLEHLYNLRQAAEQRRQRLTAPDRFNAVLQGDFTDYVTEDGEKYRIGGVTEYLSRFNLVSQVLDTETALDLIAVVEGALTEIAELGQELAGQIILVTDNGPAMKSRRFRNFVKKTELLIHVRSRKYHPQTIGREERYHGSLKLEHLYRVLPNNRTELIEEVKKYRQFYNYERLHMSLGYRTPAEVYLNKDCH